MGINYNGPSSIYNISTDRIDYNVDSIISDLEPDASAFTTILMKARKKATDTHRLEWWEQEPDFGWTQVNGAVTNAATSVVVDDATLFAPKDLVKCPRTGEVFFVTAVNAGTNTLTVDTRPYSGTATAMNDDDYLVRLGNAMEENSSAPTSKLIQPVRKYNYIQTIRTPFDGSDITEVEAVKAGDKERIRLRKIKMFTHKLELERIALWGERKEDTTNKRSTTGGIFSFITTNTKDAGGTLTEAEFEDFLRMSFSYGSASKILVCSYFVAGIINQFAQGKIQTSTGEDTYGIRLRMYKSFFGDLYIVPSKTFTKYYNGHAVCLDMKNILYRPLEGRDTKLKQNIQANDTDGWKDEFITKFGMQVQQEKTHGILYGVTG